MSDEKNLENDDDFLDEIMCTCSGTTRVQIITLVVEGLDLDAISRKTGALSGCAGCEWDVGQLVKQITEST